MMLMTSHIQSETQILPSLSDCLSGGPTAIKSGRDNYGKWVLLILTPQKGRGSHVMVDKIITQE